LGASGTPTFCLSYDVLTAVTINTAAFCDMTQYILADMLDANSSGLQMGTAGSSEAVTGLHNL
jgi:hypothetical protein